MYLLLMISTYNLMSTAKQFTIIYRWLLEHLGFEQHISVSTHWCGHTLDLVITSISSPLAFKIESSNLWFSDLFALTFETDFTKPDNAVKKTKYINRKNVNMLTVKLSIVYPSSANQFIKHVVLTYNQSLTAVFYIHFPDLTRAIIIVNDTLNFLGPNEQSNADMNGRKRKRALKRVRLDTLLNAIATTTYVQKLRQRFFLWNRRWIYKWRWSRISNQSHIWTTSTESEDPSVITSMSNTTSKLDPHTYRYPKGLLRWDISACDLNHQPVFERSRPLQ